MDIIKVYEKVTGKNNLKRCRASITSKKISDHRTLLEEIGLFQPEEGWLCYQSEVVKLSGGKLPNRADKILYGELASDNKSLHIRQRKAGWLISEIVSSPVGDMADEKEISLSKKVSYSTGRNESADYEVFRKKDTEDNRFYSGYVPESYRFVGFRARKEPR